MQSFCSGSMASNEDILKVLKSLARMKGRILPLSLVYKVLVKEGLYNSAENISKALRRLEIAGKIKQATFGLSIELLDIDTEEKEPQHRIEYVQSTLSL